MTTTYQTFAPSIGPSYTLPARLEWDGEFQLPRKASYGVFVPFGPKPERFWDLGWSVMEQGELDYVLSFFHDLGGPAEPFHWTPPVKVWAAHRAPDADTRVSGALGSRTYDARFTWYDSDTGQESTPSPAVNFAVPANEVLELTLPKFPSGVSKARIYAGDELDDMWLQPAVAETRFWVEPDTGLVSATSLAPSTNTLALTGIYQLVEQTLQHRMIGPGKWSLQLTIGERHF